jgi:hypothetical protein
MENLPLTLLIAAASALVGLLCLGLAITALLRARRVGKAPAGAVVANGKPIETPAELQSFAAKQMFSAAVMLALAVVIFIYS